MYSGPQLRLWAKIIHNGIRDDYTDPPRVPQITGLKERHKKESLADVVHGAATAIAKVFAPASSVSENEHQAVDKSVLTPSTCTELRMKNLEQLKFLQQLFVDSEAEYTEQKSTLRKHDSYM